MTQVTNSPLTVESGLACFPLNEEIHSTVIVDSTKGGLKLILKSIINPSKIYTGSTDDQKLLMDAEKAGKEVETSIEITYLASYSINDDTKSHAEATQKISWLSTPPIQVINTIIDTTSPAGTTSKVTDVAD